MKTRTKKWLGFFTAGVMALTLGCALVACGEKDDGKITVTWYDGRQELKVEELDKGSKATKWTPEKENYTFVDWYEEASLTTKFNFDTKLEEDTDIYASFMKVEYVEDTNDYYLVGTGAGTMKASNWAEEYKDELKMTKDTTVTNANVYTFEVTLYAGDQLQIVHSPKTNNNFWDAQMGIGAFKDVEKNDEDVWVVKDAEDNEIFHSEGGFGDNPVGWNAFLSTGADGIYKLILTTYPGQESFNNITFELVEKLAPLAATHNMYFTGTYGPDASTWYDNAEEGIYLTNNNGLWTGFLTVTEDMYPSWGSGAAEFKVKNAVSGSDYGYNGGNIVLVAGTWCVTYNQETNEVKYEECAYYVVGTFMDGNDQVNFSVKAGVTPKLTSTDNTTYTCTLTATDVTGNYGWIKDQGKPGVFAIKVVFGCSLGIKDWYDDKANNGDNFYLNAGTYTVTFNATTGAVTTAAN